MNYKKISINTATPEKARSKVMLIYTGGTFGMTHNAAGVLVPFDFSLILEHLPTLRSLSLDLTVISFEHPIDSSNVHPGHWQTLAQIIFDHYESQEGFVVLHGTDTMAFTASALSFMLVGLAKPVIFTGAQLPITEPRSDARENLITSLEIAAAKLNDKPRVPEVCIYFDYVLLRGNRSRKVESQHFDAFESEIYPPLAKAGVSIDYNDAAIAHPRPDKLSIRSHFEKNVTVLKLFPGIPPEVIRSAIKTPGLKALILETYGSGNAPSDQWFIELLQLAIQQGLLILNISQCPGGTVQQGKYETSKQLKDHGVISGEDMTVEAGITKLMLCIGTYGVEASRKLIQQPLAGEITAMIP
jgi:L-asparaginase